MKNSVVDLDSILETINLLMYGFFDAADSTLHCKQTGGSNTQIELLQKKQEEALDKYGAYISEKKPILTELLVSNPMFREKVHSILFGHISVFPEFNINTLPKHSISPLPKRRNISNGKRFGILKRDNYRCQICGKPGSEVGVELHVDHKVPVAKGGGNNMENLWTLCDRCNLGKSDKDL